MKSFEAKLYIEDNLATIEFDVMMKGKYDEDYTPEWNFGIVFDNDTRTRLTLSVYNADNMRMVGEIFQTDNHGDLCMLNIGNRMDPRTEKEKSDIIQNKNLAKEISLQFLDLWLKGKRCIKYNYLYPHEEPEHLPLPQKHIRNEKELWTEGKNVAATPLDAVAWDIYVKKPGETEFVWHRTEAEEIDTESDLEMRDVYEQIKRDKLSKTYPDGTPARTVPTVRDEDGKLKPKEN